MKQKDIQRFVDLVTGPPIDAYDAAGEQRKREHLRLGRAVARELAKQLGLAAGSYDVRTQAAGIAVPGDITLHGEWVYVSLGQCSMHGAFMFRSCKGRKEYAGGPNRWIGYDALLDMPDLVARIKQECRHE